jgi:hypothetical protein
LRAEATSPAARRALSIGLGDALFVVRAHDIMALDEDGAAARIPVNHTVELSPLLGITTSVEHAAVRLVVAAGRKRVALRAPATIGFVEPVALYRLPRLIAALGCRPWVIGVALLPGEPDPRIAIRIDPRRLALEATHESEEG